MQGTRGVSPENVTLRALSQQGNIAWTAYRAAEVQGAHRIKKIARMKKGHDTKRSLTAMIPTPKPSVRSAKAAMGRSLDLKLAGRTAVLMG
ncbi:hypothetical protein Tdes44962_MAKER01697 [Teratosphaeria destructans]|uniref:Uncharacterized protein n=1 Tax=Teratosphaeria destructans TaxID=418781 RepID=A0A9W7SY27_9PEZI|nr:hypothetical protein Tdes44962_MAKER01697 [Teratosphaeria destructans]